MVHSEEEYEKAVEASNILFGNAATETLLKLDEQTLLQVFEGVPQFDIAMSDLEGEGNAFSELFVEKAPVFASKGELRRLVQGGGISMNKEKVTDAETKVTESNLLAGKYILLQKGKKNYFLIKVQ